MVSTTAATSAIAMTELVPTTTIGLPSKFQGPSPIINTTTTSNTTGNTPTAESSGKGFLKPLPEMTLLERVAGIVAMMAIGTAIGMAIAAAIMEQSIIVIVEAILSSIIGPYCYYQQTKLTDIRTLQETKTAITEDVNQLTVQNQRLVQNINNLTSSVDRLEEIEQALKVLTNTQGLSIDAFQKQVTDNQQILSQMKKKRTS
jgi:cell division protein FtsB